MREILFRGKSTNNGEWVYGVPVIAKDDITDKDITVMVNNPNEIVPMEGLPLFEQVDPETVGQFTGLTDKNGRRIFEGDIVGAKHPEQRKAVPCLVGFGEFEDVDSLDNYNYMGWFLKAYGKCLSILEPGKDEIDLEVIGNIHDNPELMGVAQ